MFVFRQTRVSVASSQAITKELNHLLPKRIPEDIDRGLQKIS